MLSRWSLSRSFLPFDAVSCPLWRAAAHSRLLSQDDFCVGLDVDKGDSGGDVGLCGVEGG
jgi:hypothetical protein